MPGKDLERGSSGNEGPVGRHCGDLPAVSGELLTPLWWQQNVRTPVLTHSSFSRILDLNLLSPLTNLPLFWKFLNER
jgi:hypothetical protein